LRNSRHCGPGPPPTQTTQTTSITIPRIRRRVNRYDGDFSQIRPRNLQKHKQTSVPMAEKSPKSVENVQSPGGAYGARARSVHWTPTDFVPGSYGGPLRKQDQIKKNNNYQLQATVLVDVCCRIFGEVRQKKTSTRGKDCVQARNRRGQDWRPPMWELFQQRLRNEQTFYGWRPIGRLWVRLDSPLISRPGGCWPRVATPAPSGDTAWCRDRGPSATVSCGVISLTAWICVIAAGAPLGGSGKPTRPVAAAASATAESADAGNAPPGGSLRGGSSATASGCSTGSAAGVAGAAG
jgi:hypothetical protein